MTSYPQDFPFGIMDVVELLHLRIRRRQAGSVYTDCPFCGDCRGKMNINFTKNVWRCNYCDEHGGMLALYAKYHNTTNSDAYREICDALQAGDTNWGYGESERAPTAYSVGVGTHSPQNELPQSERASAQDIHQTFSMLFGMLTLKPAHREHLRSDKRGLTDEQIDRFGFRSTPPYFLCRSLTERLVKQGCVVQGVPGFYQADNGEWTVKFSSRMSGILIPAVGIDGLIRGAQIMLDVPIKNKDDPPEKQGTKYLWLSSSNKPMGVTSGSPVHFVGNPFSRTIYVTEGLLKADIANCLMNRSFAAIAGANNVQQLDTLFALLAQNGTELIIEAHDMDKYSNEMTEKGSSKVYLLSKKYGMECRRLTWNPNYKGIDDWQLALRRNKEKEGMNFKQSYLNGLCGVEFVDNCIEQWHSGRQQEISLSEYLGLTENEYEIFCREGNCALKVLLDTQRREQGVRIYQLDFSEEERTIVFAFKGIQWMYKAGFEQPPAGKYRLVYDGKAFCPAGMTDGELLGRLFHDFSNGKEPQHYQGRPISPSDIIELYDEEKRDYFYVDSPQFVPVRFSPFLAKPMKNK